MHTWGDDSVDWDGINEAARYIGLGLTFWGRMAVTQYKEKWGTVRVYCHFGWYSMSSITHPGHICSRYPLWLRNLDCKVLRHIVTPMNRLVIPYQCWLYRRYYKNAIRRWPHLKNEILVCADYPGLLKGLDLERTKTDLRKCPKCGVRLEGELNYETLRCPNCGYSWDRGG